MDRGEIQRMLDERPIRMLVVDDSEDDAFLLYSELVSRGAKIDYQRVDNASEMAAAVTAGEWDVILCDHNMPGFDSFGALEVLKQSSKDIPFIIYSGAISDAQAIIAMGNGVSDYIQKGNFARLVPVIERELRGAATRRAVRQADHRIKELAFYDSLSSLPNHNLFCARVDEWIAEWEHRGKEPCGALYYIDVDRFMRINSSFGYDIGNQILRQVAQRLGECAGQHAMLARLGGDEFGVFYPQLAGKARHSMRRS
jgi:PleD family two-component response regulator